MSYGFAHNNRFSFKCFHAAGALQICGHVLQRKNACAQDISPRDFDDTTCHVFEVKGYCVQWLCANSILGTSKKYCSMRLRVFSQHAVYRKLTLKQDARFHSLVYWIVSFLSWRRRFEYIVYHRWPTWSLSPTLPSSKLFAMQQTNSRRKASQSKIIKPLPPMSDQERNSPYNINTITSVDIKHKNKVKYQLRDSNSPN